MVEFSVLFTCVRGCRVRHAHGYRYFPQLLGLPLLTPFRSRPFARLHLQSTHSAGTLLPLYLTPPSRFLHGRTPRLRSVVVLHWLRGGCQRLGFSSNVCNAATVYSGPCSPIVLPSLSVTLGFVSGYNNYLVCWRLRQRFSC